MIFTTYIICLISLALVTAFLCALWALCRRAPELPEPQPDGRDRINRH
jgi:hypothetical protein